MEFHSSRGIRSLICLVSVLVFASAPLAAQRGIDLLNADEVLRLNSPRLEPVELRRAEPVEPTSTVRLVASRDPGSTDPERVVGATRHTTKYQYDDDEFENYVGTTATPRPFLFATEVAQQFDLDRAGKLVSVTACFHRPSADPFRTVVFDLLFYADDDDNPGARGGLIYTWESNALRRAGDDRCLTFSGAMAGRSLRRGKQWIAVRWQTNTYKVLGEDRYAATDTPPRDSRGQIEYDTSVRMRTQTSADAPWPELFSDPRASGVQLKAYGIRLVVDESPPVTTDPDPDPDPDPEPDPSCSGGTCVVQDDRFRIRARYSIAGMPGQTAGTTSAVLGGSAALFTFGGDSPELLVRVVDECSASGTSGNWAVYAGAASSATYSFAVRDTMTDTLKWFSARGGASVADTEAFACSN